MAGDDPSGDLNNPETWKNTGNEFFSKGDYESAIRCYTHAIEQNPNYIDAWNNLGLSLLKIGKIDEAKQVNAKVKALKNEMSDEEVTTKHASPDPPRNEEPPYQKRKIKYPKNPAIAGILSFFFFGLGQIYNGENKKGILLFFGTYIGFAALILPGIIIWMYGIYDAYKTAKKMNIGEILSKETNILVVILYFIMYVLIGIVLAAVVAAFIFGLAGPTSIVYSAAVTLAETNNGFELTWQGGTDITEITSWKVCDYSTGSYTILLEKQVETPKIGQVDRYTGGSIKGKRIVVIVKFKDGAEQVIYDKQF